MKRIFSVGILEPAMLWWLWLLVVVLLLQPCTGFRTTVSTSSLTKTSISYYRGHYATIMMMSRGVDHYYDDDNDSHHHSLPETAQELKRLRERSMFGPIVDDLFRSSSRHHSNNKGNTRPLVDLALVGRGTVGAWGRPDRSLGSQSLHHQKEKQPILCVFLSTPESSDEIISHYLKRRYPSWEIPPDLKKKLSTRVTGTACPDIPAIPLPLPLTLETSKEIKLLSFAFRGRPISKSVFLPLAHLLTDRDGASLWNNLPWTEWTIDPQHKVPTHYSQTQSGKKYLLGRRDAYNRMIGKDWYGRSLSAGNLAARAKYKLEGDDDEDDDQRKQKKEEQAVNNNMESDLAFRILQVQVKEATMELAEAEHRYAMIKARFQEDDDDDDDNSKEISDQVLLAHYEEIKASVEEVERALKAKKDVEHALEDLKTNMSDKQSETQLEATVNEFLENLVQSRYMGGNSKDKKNKDSRSEGSNSWGEAARKFVEGIRKHDNLMDDLNTILDRETTSKWKNPIITFLDGVIERETRNAPPYRGAMGYAPQVDTKEEMFSKAVLPYRSPYDLLVEIIEEQFNAQVIGTVLENSSLFPGTLILEGAVVLRRRGKSQTIAIGGEEVQLEDSQDDMGNKGVKMGEIVVVECSGQEAIGMSLSCHLPISVERKVWEEAGTDITLSGKVEPLPTHQKESVMNTIPPVKQAPNSSNRVTVTEGGEALIGGRTKQQQQQQQEEEDEEQSDSVVESSSVKSIHSLADFDSLTIPEKATMILSSGEFEGTLPRPRVLRKFEEDLENFRNQRQSRQDRAVGDEEEEGDVSIHTTLSPLDEILVPMLEDESVRLDILQRDAKERDDQLAIESIQRSIDELQEEQRQQQAATTNDDDSIPSISIQQSIDEKLFQEEMKNQIWTTEERDDVVVDEETEDQEPSIFE